MLLVLKASTPNQLYNFNEKLMGKLVKELLNFLETATPQQLEENWKDLEKYSNIGPNAEEFVNKQLNN